MIPGGRGKGQASEERIDLCYTGFMEKEIIFVVEEAPEGGYNARALGHAIFTEADDLTELKKNVQEAVQCHFEPEDMPRLIRLHMVKDEVIRYEAAQGYGRRRTYLPSRQIRLSGNAPDRQPRQTNLQL
jgi:hypothetical protein